MLRPIKKYTMKKIKKDRPAAVVTHPTVEQDGNT